MTAPAPSWSLVIHGGAGTIVREQLTAAEDARARAALTRALDAGAAILSAGGNALDAVEAAVCVLEDDPHFNAGRGAAFTHDATIELDAAIMDGRDRSAGAVAGVVGTRHPVSLARRVKEATPHVLLTGAGAEAFARTQGLEQADPAWFETPERRRQLEEMQAGGGEAFDVEMKYGTVGAVARDLGGHLAAATSTGGVTGKRWGRVGDSPLVGAGTYADDRSVAVSCTGSGEYFIRVGVGHEIGARVRLAGAGVHDAATAVLEEVRAMGGLGGTIVVGPAGEAAWTFTTPGMYRGLATSAGERRVAIYGDEG